MLAEDSRFRNNLFPDLTGEHDQAWYRQSLLSSVNYGRGLTAAAATTYYEAFASAAGLGAELVVAANDVAQNGVNGRQVLGIAGFAGLGMIVKGGGRLADAVPVPPPTSRLVHLSSRNVQKIFQKHGKDFGLTGNWNSRRGPEVSRTLNMHVNDSATRRIAGTYRGKDVLHYVNPSSGLDVFTDAQQNAIGA